MKVFVDDDKCGGHGVCCAIAPDVFELTDDGYAVVRTPEVAPEFEDDVRAAVNQCPALAISIEL